MQCSESGGVYIVHSLLLLSHSPLSLATCCIFQVDGCWSIAVCVSGGCGCDWTLHGTLQGDPARGSSGIQVAAAASLISCSARSDPPQCRVLAGLMNASTSCRSMSCAAPGAATVASGPAMLWLFVLRNTREMNRLCLVEWLAY